MAAPPIQPPCRPREPALTSACPAAGAAPTTPVLVPKAAPAGGALGLGGTTELAPGRTGRFDQSPTDRPRCPERRRRRLDGLAPHARSKTSDFQVSSNGIELRRNTRKPNRGRAKRDRGEGGGCCRLQRIVRRPGYKGIAVAGLTGRNLRIPSMMAATSQIPLVSASLSRKRWACVTPRRSKNQ